MTQVCCYRVWDGSHEKFRRTVILLALVDLLVISSVIAYVGISLYKHATMDEPLDPGHANTSIINTDNEPSHDEVGEKTIIDSKVMCGIDDDDCAPGATHASMLHENKTSRIIFPPTPYFQCNIGFEMVGYRITKSIQLIIYTCQLCMTIVLVRGLIRTDTQTMRTWLITTEIITTIILLVLVLYLFGSFQTDTVIITTSYLFYQFIMIRTVARFIRRTEIELTQFGSIVDF